MSSLRCVALLAFVSFWASAAGKAVNPDVLAENKAGDKKPESQTLMTYRDEAYAIEAAVGTPPQKVRLAFRSSSEDSVVAGSQCARCCHHQTFNPSNSLTYRKVGDIWKDHKTRLIHNSTDDFHSFGEKEKKYPFFLTVFSNSTDTFAEQPFDGHFTIALLLKKHKKELLMPVFTMFMKRTCAAGYSSDAGRITINGFDTDNCGAAIIEVPNRCGDTRYSVQLDSFTFGTQKMSSIWNGVLSSKAPDLIVPQAVFDKLNTVFKSTLTNGKYIVNCALNPGSLKLSVGGTILEVPWGQLVSQVGQTCELLIRPRPADHSIEDPFEWSLGMPFSRQFCQIYSADGSRISFAPHTVPTDGKCVYAAPPAPAPAC